MSAPAKTLAEAFEDLSDALAEAGRRAADVFAPLVRRRIEREEREATRALGFVECSGQHAHTLSAGPAELVETRRPLPQHTLDLLSDPRLAQVCPECGAAL